MGHGLLVHEIGLIPNQPEPSSLERISDKVLQAENSDTATPTMPSWCRRSVTGGLAGPFKRSTGCARHRFVDTVTTVSYEYSGSIYTIMMHSKQTSVSGCKWQGGREYAGPTFKTSHPAGIKTVSSIF